MTLMSTVLLSSVIWTRQLCERYAIFQQGFTVGSVSKCSHDGSHRMSFFFVLTQVVTLSAYQWHQQGDVSESVTCKIIYFRF